jgi:transposase
MTRWSSYLPRHAAARLRRVPNRCLLLTLWPGLLHHYQGLYLDAWLTWARRCRIPTFVALARSVTAYRDTIVANLLYGASNARVESVNTKLRLLTRIAFGFKSPEALIGLAMLALGELCPPLPGRA